MCFDSDRLWISSMDRSRWADLSDCHPLHQWSPVQVYEGIPVEERKEIFSLWSGRTVGRTQSGVWRYYVCSRSYMSLKHYSTWVQCTIVNIFMWVFYFDFVVKHGTLISSHVIHIMWWIYRSGLWGAPVYSSFTNDLE